MKCLLLTMALFAAAGSQAQKHPFGADDWAALRSAHPVAISPQAEVLYTVGHGGSAGPTVEEWHTIGIDGAGERKLELPEGFRPSGYTKDGDYYGTFSVGKASQLAVFANTGLSSASVPKAVIFLPSGVGSASISPDGTRFAILANPKPPIQDSTVKTVIEPDQTSLYVVNLDGSAGKWWAPELTNVASIAWNPDGKTIAVLSATPKIGFHYVKSQIDVVTDQGPQRIANIDNACSGIAWADGGKDIAFLSTTTSVLTPDHLWTVPASGGKPIDRTPKLEASAVGLAGDARGRVWVQVNKGAITEIDRYENGNLSLAYRNAAGEVSMPTLSELSAATDRFVFSASDPEHATNLAVAEAAGIKRLTNEGDSQLAGINLGATKLIHWTSKEGTKLEGVATFPPAYVEGKKYPFIVVPHGGPESNNTLGFDVFSQFFANLGYVVIQPNYRGSTGYGSAFLDAIYQHFGDRAYRDVDSATDYAIAQGWADPNRLAIMGWSAGGFMTSWTVTQTHRYKVAIEGAGITDWGSFIWTSDVQQIDYDARWPGKEPQYFHMFSAVNFADQVTTPLLILHGAADRRVPTFQGQEYFEALIANGKTVRMVTYPGSGHFPSLWEQRRDLCAEMAAWLKKYNP